MPISLDSLRSQETRAAIYDFALGIARGLDLPVDSWLAGDPTRSLYHILSAKLEAYEANVAGFIESGFKGFASKIWLKVHAEQVYNYTVPPATYASTDVTLTNVGLGAFFGTYTIDVGDVTVKAESTGKTYRNTTGGTLSSTPGSTLSLTFVADEAGSASIASPGEIDTMITQLLGVTCTNPTSAIGVDEQSEDVTKQACDDKLDTLSPDGPRGAYAFFARSAEHGGTAAITRVRVFASTTTGTVTVYLANASGGATATERAAAESAIVNWATPLTATPVVLAASNVVIPVTYTIWIYQSVNKTAAQVKAAVLLSLQDLFASRPIGGDVIPPATTGALYLDKIKEAILNTYPEAFRVSVSAPSGDTALTNSQVAVLGTVTGTVNLVTGP